MKTVLVFKTSVLDQKGVKRLKPKLNQLVNKNGEWNFDLEDCDNILRVETKNIGAFTISSLLQENGFVCEELH
ncbi:hypothetical protein F8C76_06540 [Flagellimonas olearia]|uniref:Uncharacterized protein n=1 Tax=Flagellimonas olearia TaxID=552546 RepID=A0A6I1E0L8_9FLAO|nr:hypothetical protein [Allomuricauda olearia]KAB7531148.1 hypothetical protein F8C76_06540 [Allomuricauda olearia]